MAVKFKFKKGNPARGLSPCYKGHPYGSLSLCKKLSQSAHSLRRNPRARPVRRHSLHAARLLAPAWGSVCLDRVSREKFHAHRLWPRRQLALVSWVLFEGKLVGSLIRWPLREKNIKEYHVSSIAPRASSSTARRTAAPTARQCRRTRTIRTATSSLTTPRGGATPLPRRVQTLLLLLRSNPPLRGGIKRFPRALSRARGSGQKARRVGYRGSLREKGNMTCGSPPLSYPAGCCPWPPFPWRCGGRAWQVAQAGCQATLRSSQK